MTCQILETVNIYGRHKGNVLLDFKFMFYGVSWMATDFLIHRTLPYIFLSLKQTFCILLSILAKSLKDNSSGNCLHSYPTIQCRIAIRLREFILYIADSYVGEYKII